MNLRFLVTALLAGTLANLASVSVVEAQLPGDLLDTYVEDLGGSDTYNSVVRLGGLTKGSIIVVGGSTDVNLSSDMVLAQYIAGSGGSGFILDPSFNGGLPIIYDFQLDPNLLDDFGNWVDTDGIDTDFDGIDDDFEVYLGGTTETAGGQALFGGVVKFSSLGVLDTGYANSGEGILCVGTEWGLDGFASDTGEVVMTGPQFESTLPGGTDFWTGRLLSNGFADMAFGPNGCLIEYLLNSFEAGITVLDYDGNKILTVGNTTVTGTDVHLIRYLNTGAFDPAFGMGTGKVTTTSITIGGIGYSPYVSDAAVMKRPNGNARRTVVVGLGIPPLGGNQELFMVRYLNNGMLDPIFGVGGVVNDTLGLASMSPVAVAIDRNLKIVVVGNTPTGMWVARYDRFGVLDPNFGIGGFVTTAGFENVADAIIGPNGLNIIVVGNVAGDGFIYRWKG